MSEAEATDAAGQLAAEHGIDLADVTGTGADGRVTKADVEQHLAAQPPFESTPEGSAPIEEAVAEIQPRDVPPDERLEEAPGAEEIGPPTDAPTPDDGLSTDDLGLGEDQPAGFAPKLWTGPRR